MSSLKPRCYVASPLGFSEGGRHFYRTVYLPALADVVTPVDPWALSTPEVTASEVATSEQKRRLLAIGSRNAAAIRSCTCLVAYLDGQELDSGTVAELGFAAGVGLRCFGLRTDSRQHGESATAVNLQVESFVVESGGRISRTLSELIHDLAEAFTD